MKDSSRRSFVKTSAATGLTFTFAGLIRAHGQSGGGNTTWNPEGTFFSTNSGETTTYDPNGTYVTTDPGVTTTWDPDATTVPETTMPEETTTVPETTAPCPKKYLDRIEVVFTTATAVTNQSDKGKWEYLPGYPPGTVTGTPIYSPGAYWKEDKGNKLADASGHRVSGFMKVTLKVCSTGEEIFRFYPCYSGGYIQAGLCGSLLPGDETAIPAGQYIISRQTDNTGNADGVNVSGSDLGTRFDIEIHQPGVTTGCIVVGDSNSLREDGINMGYLYRYFMDFQDFIENGTQKVPCSPAINSSGCPLVIPAKLFVWYLIPTHPSLAGSKDHGVPGVNPPGAPPSLPPQIPIPPVFGL